MKKNIETKNIQIRKIETLSSKDLVDVVGGPLDGESTDGGTGRT